jgi:hypothetical protein
MFNYNEKSGYTSIDGEDITVGAYFFSKKTVTLYEL